MSASLVGSEMCIRDSVMLGRIRAFRRAWCVTPHAQRHLAGALVEYARTMPDTVVEQGRLSPQ
eukprot:4669277-Alexandrium_andersonii.AAC.1